ncbi:uncharacterized protein LOC142572276 isoform X1 [Dermacentor variabilis]|uniref:uncharacterized protein LOC142572276 isoform X1 n=1 Tax=Dermacentor variabilis TaxID=34621 RepID=UPI003F5B0567
MCSCAWPQPPRGCWHAGYPSALRGRRVVLPRASLPRARAPAELSTPYPKADQCLDFHWHLSEMGIETQEEQPSVLASVGGLFSKIKSYIPTRKGGADFTTAAGAQGGPNTDNQTAVDGSREVMESQ